MGMRLKDKAAVVTGSSMGVGRAVALLMAEEGADLVLTGRNIEPLNQVAKEIQNLGRRAVIAQGDVSIKEQAERMIDAAVDSFGKIDILVNNAGITRDRMIFNLTDEEWDEVVKVHLYGYFHCARRACQLMRQQRSGRILNMSSRVAMGTVGQANYVAAKAGVLGFTYSVARDMGKYGVTCNAIFPAAGTRQTITPEYLASKEKRAASGVKTEARAGEELPPPECVAPIVVYLASDEAVNINGQVFFSWGGEIAHYSPIAPTKSVFAPAGKWTVDELEATFPATLGRDLVNPAPAQL
ncbi:SDR family NAD(P)-dependent oxidoreductase [Chloroflexota bacterium]